MVTLHSRNDTRHDNTGLHHHHHHRHRRGGGTSTSAAAEDSTDAQSEEDSTPWHLFGTVCPKEEIVFLCQVLVLFTVILISIYNLTTGHENSNLWTALVE